MIMRIRSILINMFFFLIPNPAAKGCDATHRPPVDKTERACSVLETERTIRTSSPEEALA